MEWKDINNQSPPEEQPFDVWISWIDERGKLTGERICNCWLYCGSIYHGQAKVNFVTHWMQRPLPPKISA